MNEPDDIADDYTELPLCIISGGQTGADRGGLDAAIALGLDHGGFCPKGRLAEDGAIPPRYALKETGSAQYGERTALNVISSHATLILHREKHGELTGGSALTAKMCAKHHRPMLSVRVPPEIDKVPEAVIESMRGWLRRHRVRVLNVAGPRESKTPGIEQAVRELLVRVWRPRVEMVEIPPNIFGEPAEPVEVPPARFLVTPEQFANATMDGAVMETDSVEATIERMRGES